VTITLRPYQQAAVTALEQWDYAADGNPLLVVPTGGGKSLIQAAYIAANPEARVLCVTHVKELVAQNHGAYLQICPDQSHDKSVGIYSAGLRRRDTDSHVLFAGLQSVHRHPEKFGWFDIVIVDEVHRVPKKGAGMYLSLFEALRKTNPELRIVGMTATPFRTDSGSLTVGEDRMFHGTAYECDMTSLIEQGYLSDVHCRGTASAIDTKGVHVRAREFVAEELERRAMVDGLVEKSCVELVKRAEDRRSWLLFCTGISHAGSVAKELREVHGITCGEVYGHTPIDERDEVIRAYKAGEIRALVNCSVLTTGFDAPQTDVIALLRPTMSPVLYCQMVGRGLRLAPGKTDALVLDFGGNVMRHGPINDVRLSQDAREQAATKSAPVKECPECHSFMPSAVMMCTACGHKWPLKMPSHDEMPADGVLVIRNKCGDATGVERWLVNSVHYSYHAARKLGNRPTLRVSYLCAAGRRANQFICFEHPKGTYPRLKAEHWWGSAVGDDVAVPWSVGEAARLLTGDIAVKTAAEITVDTRGPWPDVKRVTMRSLEAATP